MKKFPFQSQLLPILTALLFLAPFSHAFSWEEDFDSPSGDENSPLLVPEQPQSLLPASPPAPIFPAPVPPSPLPPPLSPLISPASPSLPPSIPPAISPAFPQVWPPPSSAPSVPPAVSPTFPPQISPPPSSSPSLPPSVSPSVTPIEYIDPTLPPLLPTKNPKCTLHILHQDLPNFASPPPVTAAYSPPSGCPAPWSRIVLQLSGTASDLQKDHTAAIWLNQAEILRTSTPLPMTPGVFWHVEKDVTRYTALFRTASQLSVTLMDADSVSSGVFTANVSIHFYRGPIRHDRSITENARSFSGSAAVPVHPSIKGIYQEPPSMIIPISAENYGSNGFWFRVENETEVQVKNLAIPNNTYRAVLEVYASHHGGDEYWYVNPLCSGDVKLTLDGLESAKPNGAFRQLVASIDGKYVGSAIPFPIIYPSSINPYFWAPVAAIGAYDHPSYDLEITSFIGLLLDGKPHAFGVTVSESQPYWLISANLHLWLDEWSDEVEAGLVRYKAPPFHLSRKADWDVGEGKSEMEGQIIYRFAGWVSSSKGNLTTFIRHRVKFKSQVEVEEKSESKNAELEVKERINIRIESDDDVLERMVVDRETPLLMDTMTSNSGGETVLHKTKLVHGLHETRRITRARMDVFSTVADRQESEGTVLVQDGMAMWGSGDTKSMYKFRDGKDCYLRTLNIVGGKVKQDEASASCFAAAVASA